MFKTLLKTASIVAACAFSAVVAVQATAASKPKDRVFEMRTYTAHPGKAEDMHKRFRDHTCKLFKKHGMELVGFWVPQDEKKKDVLIYILAFPSRDAAKASWKAFQDDPEWKKVYAESHKNGPLVAKVESVFMDPADYSDIK